MISDKKTRSSVVLVGHGPTSRSAIQSLCEHCLVLLVASDVPATLEFANEMGIKTTGPLLTNRQLCEILTETGPDFTVISSFNRRIDPHTLSLSRFVNVHYSPLPAYRGRANVNWAIINGENATAITIHFVDEAIDTGNILFQEPVAITKEETVTSLYEKLNNLQLKHLGATIVAAAAGYRGAPQNDGAATYCCGRLPEDGEIDWSEPAIEIDRLIRALAPPFPPAFTYLGMKCVAINKATLVDERRLYIGQITGRIVGRSVNEGWVDVLAGDGVVRLESVTIDGVSTPAASAISTTRATLGLSKVALLKFAFELEGRLALLEGQAAGRRSKMSP